MKTKAKYRIFGGPEDGGEVELDLAGPVAHVVEGPVFTTREPPVRQGRKMYTYLRNPRYARLEFSGEEVAWDDAVEGVE